MSIEFGDTVYLRPYPLESDVLKSAIGELLRALATQCEKKYTVSLVILARVSHAPRSFRREVLLT